MEDTAKKIFIIAGEASGDLHGAHLVRSLQSLNPHLKFYGLGGEKMREAGVEIFEDMTKIAVVGFIEVLKHYGEFRRIFNDTIDKARNMKPDAVILIDYPGFNLRLAQALHRRKIKVIYYISPQVWAWKESRVGLIKKCVDRMLVLFEFEKDFYAQYGVDVKFIGHPLLDIIQVARSKEEILKSLRLSDFNMTIGILPGSRSQEIERHLPVMLSAAKLLSGQFPMMQFIILKAPTIARETIESFTKGYSLQHSISEQDPYESISACDLCMVASGTATLETALLGKPMVVVYKTSLLTWLLAKMFVKIPNIGLVNVVARRRIVPECVQFDATPENIAGALKDIFTNELRISEIKYELKRVKESLGKTGACERAAREVLSVLGK